MLTLAADGLAAFRVARLVIDDTLFDTPRDVLHTRLEEGGPFARKALEGLTCYHCVGLYAAAAVVLIRRYQPAVVDALAAAALVGFLAQAQEHL